MGTVFQHVADHALVSIEAAACQCCAHEDTPVYGYFGTIIRPELAADPALAVSEPTVYEVCADCIHAGLVDKADLTTALRTIATHAADPAAARHALMYLPDIPLFLQGFDWPMCCGNWCEFTGVPASDDALPGLQASHRAWPADSHPRDFARDGGPESLCEISMFRCQTCGQGHYTDQFT